MTPPLPSSARSEKEKIARALGAVGWNAALSRTERRLGWMRVFNTHGTPPRHAESFGRQLDHILARYEAVDPYRLEEMLAEGPRGGRPLCAFTFDDGLRNHYVVAAAELEKRGLRGIFSVPSDFPSLPEAEQAAWFRRRVRAVPDAEHATDEDMLAMSWEQVRELAARGHRICSHTQSHEVIGRGLPLDLLRTEIVDSRHRLEERLGVPVDGFCWPVERDPAAADAIRLIRETYAYSLVGDTKALRKGHDPLDVNRTRIESSWSLDVVDFQLSGIVDALFVLRRRKGVAGTRAR